VSSGRAMDSRQAIPLIPTLAEPARVTHQAARPHASPPARAPGREPATRGSERLADLSAALEAIPIRTQAMAHQLTQQAHAAVCQVQGVSQPLHAASQYVNDAAMEGIALTEAAADGMAHRLSLQLRALTPPVRKAPTVDPPPIPVKEPVRGSKRPASTSAPTEWLTHMAAGRGVAPMDVRVGLGSWWAPHKATTSQTVRQAAGKTAGKADSKTANKANSKATSAPPASAQRQARLQWQITDPRKERLRRAARVLRSTRKERKPLGVETMIAAHVPHVAKALRGAKQERKLQGLEAIAARVAQERKLQGLEAIAARVEQERKLQGREAIAARVESAATLRWKPLFASPAQRDPQLRWRTAEPKQQRRAQQPWPPLLVWSMDDVTRRET